MISVRPVLLTALLATATIPLSSCSYVGMKIFDWASAPRAHTVAVIDGPASTKQGCADIVPTIRKAITANPQIGTGSRLAVIRTRTAAAEAELVLDEALPGPQVIGTQAGAVEKLLLRAGKVCGGLPAGQRSPLELAIRKGLTLLRGLGCDAQSGCTLIVHAEVREGRRTPRSPTMRRGTAFDNGGIPVFFCGFSENGADQKSAESLMSAWKPFFSHPKHVVAFCAERQGS